MILTKQPTKCNAFLKPEVLVSIWTVLWISIRQLYLRSQLRRLPQNLCFCLELFRGERTLNSRETVSTNTPVEK